MSVHIVADACRRVASGYADPTIVEPTAAVIRLAASCICGSDLWPYRGAEEADYLLRGHEYFGVVEEIPVPAYVT